LQVTPRLLATVDRLGEIANELGRGIVGVGDNDEEAARGLDRAGETVNFASMASVLAIACRLQARMLGAPDLLAEMDLIDATLSAIAKASAA
jgi:hypothetical protein